jgi:hypothetical protein
LFYTSSRAWTKFDVSTEQTASITAPVLLVRYSCPYGGRPRYDHEPMTFLSGLVLEPTASGTHRRIGTFAITAGRGEIGQVMSFLEYPEAKVVTIV